MLGKTVSLAVMYFAVVFVILFRISLGLHLHFGLDQIFHGLTGGKTELFNFGKSAESKSIKSDGNVQANKDSSILEDSLGTIVGKAGAVLNGSIVKDSLETVAGEAGKAGKILEDSLETIVGKKAGGAVLGSILESSLETDAVKAAKTVSGSTLGDALETVAKKTGGVVRSSIVEDTLGTVSGKGGKEVSGINLKDSLGTVAKKAGEAISGSALKDSLGTVAGKASKAVSGSVLEDSLETVSRKGGGEVRSSVVESSLGTLAGKAGKAISGSALKDSLGTVAGKASKAVSGSILEDSLGTVTKKTGGAVRDITLEDSSENISGKVSGVVRSRVAESSLGTVAGKAGEAISGSALKDSLGTVAGKAGKAISGSALQDSVGTVAGKASKAVSGSKLKDSLEMIPGKSSKAVSVSIVQDSIAGKADGDLESSLLSISDENEGLEGGLNDEIQKVPRAISNKYAVNPLQTVITEVTAGERCSSKSVVTSFPSVPAVSKFVRIVIQGVDSDHTILTILFNVTDATPLQFSQFKYRYIADVLRRLGLIDANDIAAASVRPIAKYFDILIPQVLERVHANSIANYLFAEEFLTDDNAEQLALAYLKALEESAESNGVSCNCDYNRNFQALSEGDFSFLVSVGQPSSLQAREVAFYYAHEWLLAAVDYGSLRDLTVKK